MEFKNMQAKFNLTVNIVLKTNIVKEAQKLNLDIDDVLDNYISDGNNLKQIHDLVEESLHSDLEIESINFVKNETLINAYSDSCLYITCECIVNAEKLVCVSEQLPTQIWLRLNLDGASSLRQEEPNSSPVTVSIIELYIIMFTKDRSLPSAYLSRITLRLYLFIRLVISS